MNEQTAEFHPGQLVHHRLFNYRGVIIDVDPVFQGTEEWYDTVARSRPPKDRPWYRVLVHEQGKETYVAERNLEQDNSAQPIEHPLIDKWFESLTEGCYRPRARKN